MKRKDREMWEKDHWTIELAVRLELGTYYLRIALQLLPWWWRVKLWPIRKSDPIFRLELLPLTITAFKYRKGLSIIEEK